MKKLTPALTASSTDELDDGTGDYYEPKTDEDPPAPPVDPRQVWLALVAATPDWLGRHIYRTVIKAHAVLGAPSPFAKAHWENLTPTQRMAWNAAARAAYEEGYSDGINARKPPHKDGQ